MASVYLSAQSNAPGSSEIVLINGEPSTTGYRLLNVDVGNPAFDKKYSGPRGTLGAVLAGETAQNRLSTFRLQAVGTSQDDLEAKLSVLWILDEQLRRYGGTVIWRPQGGSYRMRIRALDSGVALEALEPALFVLNNRANVSFGVVSGPYMEGEPYDTYDAFLSNSVADYTFDTGSAGDLNFGAGSIACLSAATTEKRAMHTSKGYQYADNEVMIQFKVGATITSFKAGVVLHRIASNSYLEVYVDDNGSNSRLRIDILTVGARSNKSSTNLGSRLVNATTYWVRGRLEGDILYAEFFTVAPYPGAVPATAANFTLTGGDLGNFGGGAVGYSGWSWIPQVTGTQINQFRTKAFVRKDVTLPAAISYVGAIAGDAPALVNVQLTAPFAGNVAPFGLLAWYTIPPNSGQPQPLGIFEAETGGALSNWASAADGNYRGGNGLKFTTSGAHALAAVYSVSSLAMVPDDYRGAEIDVEVWARIELAATVVNPRMRTSLYFGGGKEQFTAEYGASYKALVKPSSGTSFRFVRLGTLTVPTSGAGNINLNAACDAGSSGQFGVDYLILVPSNSRALSPSGKANDSAYPQLYPATAATKTVNSDLSGALTFQSEATGAPDVGLGGSLIEVKPAAQLTLLAKVSSLVPDDPTSNTTSERLSETVSVHADVTPRWRLVRSS